MRLRLAGGVVAAPGLAAWLPRASSTPEQAHKPARAEQTARADEPARADESDAPGAAVALGPATASDEDVRQAVNALRLLVVDGGIVAAGAGVDLGAGFRSARLEGARGDQRDAILAALKVLGVEGAGRLGDRAGFLVALFGPAVTKRVGAAAARAIAEGRWAALHLASASSDVLGPEQLERVLALTCPEGVKDADLTGGGMSSVLAANLRRVLEPVTAPRRLDLVLDLWERVAEHHAALTRRARLLATQGRQDRLEDLRERREHHEDQYVLSAMRDYFGMEPALAAVALLARPYASLASSVSGAAQLVALGGTAKRGVRTWDGFVDALLADAKIAEALDGLDPSLHHRFGEQLALLTGTAPLPGSLRKLVRRPQLAPTYSMGLVGLRVRAAIGRLLLDGDRAIIQSVARRPARPMLCALTVHLACAHDGDTSAIDLAPVMPPRTVTVPGFPESALSDPDGPWHRAFPEARELGSDTEMFWDGIAEHGLRVPAAWLAGGGGWPVLWARAHHTRPHHTRPRPHHAKAPRGTRR